MLNLNGYYTARELGAEGIIKEYHLRQMIKNGEIPFIKAGNKFLVKYSALIETLDKMALEQAEEMKAQVNAV